jgi:pimeloyl-ACP methyl ester carboxylesterase
MSDVRGMLRLGFDATVGITDLVEHMHRTIADRALPLGPAHRGRTTGLTGIVYRTIRGVTRVISRGVDASLRRFERERESGPGHERREAALAVVNGIWGDYLATSANPLAIPMAVRCGGRTLEMSPEGLRSALPDPAGRIALMIHGLCMNDLQWLRQGRDHREMLNELGYTTLSLHYNSGLHIADNGEQFAQRLDRLVSAWPVPVEELVIVGHSMGGLVARSACHEAAAQKLPWLRLLTRVVCLGSPHHGAALERGGHLVDSLFDSSPYLAPFTRLGKARSAGITDLRFGNVQRADSGGRHRHHQRHDDRLPTPLPTGVNTYLAAATTADAPRGLRHALIGDGLVSVASAWGEHRDQRLALAVPDSNKLLVTRSNHWDLLHRDEVSQALQRWLG